MPFHGPSILLGAGIAYAVSLAVFVVLSFVDAALTVIAVVLGLAAVTSRGMFLYTKISQNKHPEAI